MNQDADGARLGKYTYHVKTWNFVTKKGIANENTVSKKGYQIFTGK